MSSLAESFKKTITGKVWDKNILLKVAKNTQAELYLLFGRRDLELLRTDTEAGPERHCRLRRDLPTPVTINFTNNHLTKKLDYTTQ